MTFRQNIILNSIISVNSFNNKWVYLKIKILRFSYYYKKEIEISTQMSQIQIRETK